jgi:hypothetical protein
MKKIFWLALGLMLVASTAWPQQNTDFLLQESGSMGEGWSGFTDLGFLVNAFLTLILAAVLGALIAYHPKHIQTADTLEEIEAPKVFITYAVIGALIGIFRTVLRSANLTGHVIFVTLIGLSCGLDLPHVAVLATVFGFVLIYLLNARLTYRINIRALAPERIADAAAAYRGVLEQQGCHIVSEKKHPNRERVTIIFHNPRRVTRVDLEKHLESDIDASLRGFLDWEID